MTRQLYIAKSGTRNAPTIPIDAVTRTFGIYGQRGTGKSNTATVMVEQVARAGAHVVVIDPKGDWWGITRAGEKRGLPGIVLGGDYGDIPLEETAGHLVAELVVGRHWPVVVLDISSLRKGARRRFAADHLEALYDLNREALLVVFEEAHQVLPQVTRRGDRGDDVILNRVIGAAEDIVTLGRKRGLGTVIVSQRFATVNATVREQVETLMLHRLSGPLDRKAAKGWIETNGDPALTTRLLNEIAGYQTGEALLYSPGWLGLHERLRIKPRTTFDSASTPEVGAVAAEPTARAPVDLDELRVRMAETVERAKANDPTELRKRLRELEAQQDYRVQQAYDEGHMVGRSAGRSEAKAERVEVLVSPRHLKQNLRAIGAEAERLGRGLAAFSEHLCDEAEALPDREGVAEQPPAETPQRAPDGASSDPAIGRRRPPAAAPRPASTPAPEDDGEIPKGARELLKVAAQYHPLRFTKAQLAALAQRGTRSSTLDTQLAKLGKAGLLDRSGGDVGVTEEGLRLVGVQPVTLDVHTWRERLPDGVGELFGALVDLGGEGTKELIAEHAGVSATSSTTDTKLAMLRRNGLVQVAHGHYYLTPLAWGSG